MTNDLNCSTRQIIHVGMGKCASTFLQQVILPELDRCIDDLKYCSNSSLVFSIRAFQRTGQQTQIEDKNYHPVVVHSCEDLIGWNCSFWEDAITDLSKLCDRKTEILLVLRDPLEYIESLYVQRLAEGDFKDIDDFVVQGNLGRAIKTSNPRFGMRFLNVDDLNYEKLIFLLKQHFNCVWVVSIEAVQNEILLKELFGLKNIDNINLHSKTRKNKRLKQAQVHALLRLSRLLSFFGLRLSDTNTPNNPRHFGSFGSGNKRYHVKSLVLKLFGLFPSKPYRPQVSHFEQNLTLRASQLFYQELKNEYKGVRRY